MSILFRILLTAGALSTGIFFLTKIRKAQVQIEDTIFWLVFSGAVLILSLFPGILNFFAGLLGIQSPVNFLFLVVIFLLLVRLFKLTLKVSMLESKLTRLAQGIVVEDTVKSKDAEENDPLLSDNSRSFSETYGNRTR